MSATHITDSSTTAKRVLYLSLELSCVTWKLCFTTGAGQAPRIRNIPARHTGVLLREIATAKQRFGLPAGAPVLCCYEAGRDGFWLHRFLTHAGVQNLVVDAASIEVSRRKHPKTDRIDGNKLLSMLVRWDNGEKTHWRVVKVPTVVDEDRRQLHRELIELKAERTSHTNRIKGLLAAVGISTAVNSKLRQRLELIRLWDDSHVPPALQQRILRELERWELVELQIRDIEVKRSEQLRANDSPAVKQARQLMRLKGVGMNGGWLLAHELGWRDIRNDRQLTSLAGLAPTPFASGGIQREQGISKAGNRRVRWMMIQLAWMWLRYQPDSQLSQWFIRRFGSGNSRIRKIGIVALARKLLIALWKYLKSDELPAGAELKGTKRLKKAAG